MASSNADAAASAENDNKGDNPGNALASAVDAEVAKFREIQDEIRNLQSNLQLVSGQETENEMVYQELALLNASEGNNKTDQVYKLIGPVLIRQDLEEARQTVQKRLEFIRAEKGKISSKIESRERRGVELQQKIQRMQSDLQRVTAQALSAIKDHHQQSNSG